MDIEQALIGEHSKRQTKEIVDFIGADKRKFNKLIKIFLKGDYRVTQRAAWPLSEVAVKNPDLVMNHLSQLVSKLSEKNCHPAVTRNILRIFQFIEIPEEYHGALIDLCFKFMMDETLPPAIRAFSITVAAGICKKYDELKRELVLCLEELAKFPRQPAIRIRSKQAFKTLHVAG